jgi:hypothetical protein
MAQGCRRRAQQQLSPIWGARQSSVARWSSYERRACRRLSRHILPFTTSWYCRLNAEQLCGTPQCHGATADHDLAPRSGSKVVEASVVARDYQSRVQQTRSAAEDLPQP